MLVSPQRTLDEVFPARAESIALARSAVVSFAGREGATEDQLDRLRLAVSEAASNVVRHAYRGESGAFHLTLTAGHDEVWALLADDGCGHQSPAVNPGMGWGLALIADVCDEFVLAVRSDGGTEARMRVLIGPTDEPG